MNPTNFATAQIVFTRDVVRNLYETNPWMKESRDHSRYAVGKTVNVPNSATVTGVINRTDVGITAVGHGHTLKSYNLDEHQTRPTTIAWSEEMLVNYPLREEVLIDHRGTFENNTAERTLFNWASNYTILSTGETKAVTVGGGALGTRKRVTENDIIKLSAYMTKNKIPNDGKRCLLISADMHGDFLKLDRFTSKDYIGNAAGEPVVQGLVGQILGFKVYVRSRVLVKEIAINATDGNYEPKAWLLDNSLTERTIGPTGTDTAIAWHPNFVSTAVSSDTLVNLIPGHGGVEISLTGIAGGSKLSVTGYGVVTLAEAVLTTV